MKKIKRVRKYIPATITDIGGVIFSGLNGLILGMNKVMLYRVSNIITAANPYAISTNGTNVMPGGCPLEDSNIAIIIKDINVKNKNDDLNIVINIC